MLERTALKNLDLPPDEIIFGASSLMRRLWEKAERAAQTAVPVVIEGESGAGKDVLARWIHARSGRKAAPFVKVHCPAIPPILLEGEMFGYERGTFTGALNFKAGRLDAAAGGSLFLDEIPGIETGLQTRLARLLREGCFTRHGGRQERQIDVRFIFSVRVPPPEETSASWQDVLAGAGSVHLRLPALRKRRGDIPAMAQYMVEACGRRYNVPVRPLSRDILNLLQASAWPANLRQLENTVKRYVVLGCEEETISAELLTQTEVDHLSRVSAGDSVALKEAVRERVKEQERRIILRALHDHHWDKKSTALALGITYQALLHKMREAEMGPAAPGSEASDAKGRDLVN